MNGILTANLNLIKSINSMPLFRTTAREIEHRLMLDAVECD